jgi:Glycosyl transferase family 2
MPVATRKTGGERQESAGEGGQIGRPLPLRVAFMGARARGVLGAGVEASEALDERADALVVGDDARGDVAAAAAGARAAGIPVIGFACGGGPEPWRGHADLIAGAVGETGEPSTLPMAPPVDVRAFNPSGFLDEGVAGYVASVRPGARAEGVQSAMELLGGAARQEPVALRAPLEMQARLRFAAGVAPGAELDLPPAELLELLHRRLGVLDHPGLHSSDFARSGWLVRLCAAGVPVVVAEPSPQLRLLLGVELADALAQAGPRDLADLDLRERLSVALRRQALRHHSVVAAWRRLAGVAGIALPGPPLVSVIFATRRQEWLEHGMSQIARQTYEPREVVAALHGDGFSPDVESRVRELAGAPVKIVRVDEELTLGDALNAGVAVAEGEVVTKMDDDDYYNTDHLWDLILALEYSGADLVGKAAEFVYLEDIDVTIRQITSDAETRLAGGGMMVRRAPLVELDGWPLRTRGEDLALIRRFLNNGRGIHRIPPHGYILNRHGRGHTWRPAVDYFLFRSERQWRGLRFDATAID